MSEPAAMGHVVRATLDAAGIAVSDAEFERLVSASASIRARAAELYVPEADGFEPADVFAAVDPQ